MRVLMLAGCIVAAGAFGAASAQQSPVPPAGPTMWPAGIPQAALYGQWKTQWPADPGPWDVVMTITNVTPTEIIGSIWAYRPINGEGGGNIPFIGKASADESYSFRIPNGNGWDGIRLCGNNMCASGYHGASGTHKPLIFTRVQ